MFTAGPELCNIENMCSFSKNSKLGGPGEGQNYVASWNALKTWCILLCNRNTQIIAAIHNKLSTITL